MPVSKVCFYVHAFPMKLSKFQFKETPNWVQKVEYFMNFCLYIAYAFLSNHKNRFVQCVEWSITDIIG